MEKMGYFMHLKLLKRRFFLPLAFFRKKLNKKALRTLCFLGLFFPCLLWAHISSNCITYLQTTLRDHSFKTPVKLMEHLQADSDQLFILSFLSEHPQLLEIHQILEDIHVPFSPQTLSQHVSGSWGQHILLQIDSPSKASLLLKQLKQLPESQNLYLTSLNELFQNSKTPEQIPQIWLDDENALGAELKSLQKELGPSPVIVNDLLVEQMLVAVPASWFHYHKELLHSLGRQLPQEAAKPFDLEAFLKEPPFQQRSLWLKYSKQLLQMEQAFLMPLSYFLKLQKAKRDFKLSLLSFPQKETSSLLKQCLFCNVKNHRVTLPLNYKNIPFPTKKAPHQRKKKEQHSPKKQDMDSFLLLTKHYPGFAAPYWAQKMFSQLISECHFPEPIAAKLLNQLQALNFKKRAGHSARYSSSLKPLNQILQFLREIIQTYDDTFKTHFLKSSSSFPESAKSFLEQIKPHTSSRIRPQRQKKTLNQKKQNPHKKWSSFQKITKSFSLSLPIEKLTEDEEDFLLELLNLQDQIAAAQEQNQALSQRALSLKAKYHVDFNGFSSIKNKLISLNDEVEMLYQTFHHEERLPEAQREQRLKSSQEKLIQWKHRLITINNALTKKEERLSQLILSQHKQKAPALNADAAYVYNEIKNHLERIKDSKKRGQSLKTPLILFDGKLILHASFFKGPLLKLTASQLRVLSKILAKFKRDEVTLEKTTIRVLNHLTHTVYKLPYSDHHSERRMFYFRLRSQKGRSRYLIATDQAREGLYDAGSIRRLINLLQSVINDYKDDVL
ncbi:MAG: hypothetical protein D6797_03165 [Bdellovibrio sp.]|nr:MAG: hypothetical protein D6797_03165 [Bdellovibrio sp.]